MTRDLTSVEASLRPGALAHGKQDVRLSTLHHWAWISRRTLARTDAAALPPSAPTRRPTPTPSPTDQYHARGNLKLKAVRFPELRTCAQQVAHMG